MDYTFQNPIRNFVGILHRLVLTSYASEGILKGVPRGSQGVTRGPKGSPKGSPQGVPPRGPKVHNRFRFTPGSVQNRFRFTPVQFRPGSGSQPVRFTPVPVQNRFRFTRAGSIRFRFGSRPSCYLNSPTQFKNESLGIGPDHPKRCSSIGEPWETGLRVESIVVYPGWP